MVIPGRNISTERYDRIVTDCKVMSNYTSLYEVKKVTANGTCDLVIVNAGKPHGGRYVCYNSNNIKSKEIFLSVLGNFPR